MNSARIKAFWVIVAIIAAAVFLVRGKQDFVLGLDLAGGSALTYTIDTSSLPSDADVEASVASLRDVVERRVNLFGVREPTVTTSYSRLVKEWRLIVELPGVTDVSAAGKMIGETPVLDFRVLKSGVDTTSSSTRLSLTDYLPTNLTGRYLNRANLVFDPTSHRPLVELLFNDEGSKLFAEITKANIGKQVAIFLDGQPISQPTVNEEITGGKAVISGSFSIEEARLLVGRLNAGALPLPIKQAGTTLVGPSFGDTAVKAGVLSGVIGFFLIIGFMVLWYRVPGLVASVALSAYAVMMLLMFKYVPVTLTAAGIAGFIISIGLAVDANVLTFERMKEEIANGKGLREAVALGFERAWTSIRDSHIAAIIVSIILFWFGTSLVKGFAFTFFLGAVVSLFSAQVITRVLLAAVASTSKSKIIAFMFGSGISK
jgi:protein-export membrane protein SecD